VAVESPAGRSVFLSTLPASRTERRRAWAVALVSIAVFLAAAPLARTRLVEVWAFIPSYQSALLIIDLITAILLFAQFLILRSPALLVIAAGYLFSALIAIPHALSFPRLFAPEGLIGAGPQTTAWLYMIWHVGFPLTVIGYALLHGARPVRQPGRAAAAAGVIVLAIAGGAALLTTSGHALLPVIMRGDGYTPLLPVVIGVVWSISLAALLVLWKRRPHSVLDVWLMVVMCAWLLDIALSAIFNAGRFDLGFYAGRVYGLLAASIVLLVLLIETGAAYARLARSFEAESDDHSRQLRELQSELIHVSRLTELGQMVSALAHEVNQPLTAIGSYVRAGLRLIQAEDSSKAADALQKAADQVVRASQVIQRLRQFVRKDAGQRDVEDIRRTIEEAAAIAMLGPEGRQVRLGTEFEPDTPLVSIDKVQIAQVLLNLIRNAVEAMQASARRELVIRTRTSGDGMVEVSVVDSGPGLPPEIRERLFQPFTTTKPSGMGVGLSICRAIVESHGGGIWVVDPPGGGTGFHFTVPAATATAGGEPTVAGSRI
jgi:signal transduction histidine kinase